MKHPITTPALATGAVPREASSTARWHRGMEAGLALFAGALYAWGASRGADHYYYTAAARSMSENWHAFEYGALDPAGSITVDKLPGMLWVEALCVRLLGFSPWVLLLPHTLAATATVPLLFAAVRHWAGPRAGLLAAVALALTPVTAATARATIPDTLLTFCLVSAGYCLTRSVTSMRRGWLVACGAMVGLGFQTKMLAALLPLPVFVTVYLVYGLGSRRARAVGAGLLAATTVVACSPWMILVAATPSANRPWLDGTTGNSVWELVFVYNGLRRGGGSAVAVPFGGEPGATRLLNPQLSGQISWLLPLAVIAVCLGAAIARRGAGWLLWGGWLLVGGIALSTANGIHPYYATILAPAVAALAGAGADLLLSGWQRREPHGWLFPLSIVITGGWAWLVVRRTPDGTAEIRHGLTVATLLAAGLLLISRLTTDKTSSKRLSIIGLTASVLAGLGGPVGWILLTPPLREHTLQTTNPVAGPYDPVVTFGSDQPQQVMGRLFGVPPIGPISTTLPGLAINPSLLDYLRAHRPGRRYLFATGDASSATPYITAGYSVLPMGGFTASSPAPTVDALTRRIDAGDLRFVYLLPMPGLGAPAGQRADWVATHCSPVDSGDLDRSDAAGEAVLYDCLPRPGK